MDIGIIPGETGIFPECRGVTGTPPGVNGPTWAMREKRRAGLLGATKGGVLLPVGVGFPLSLVGVGGKEGGERGKERGAGPPPNSDWAWGGAPPPLLLSPPFH